MNISSLNVPVFYIKIYDRLPGKMAKMLKNFNESKKKIQDLLPESHVDILWVLS